MSISFKLLSSGNNSAHCYVSTLTFSSPERLRLESRRLLCFRGKRSATIHRSPCSHFVSEQTPVPPKENHLLRISAEPNQDSCGPGWVFTTPVCLSHHCSWTFTQNKNRAHETNACTRQSFKSSRLNVDYPPF